MGPLIVLSGPSGSGKTTVIARLLAATRLPVRLAVSATTRKMRKGEQEDANYHYWTREKFEAERNAGAFLEWAEVFGNYYGTLRSEVEPYRAKGMGVILEIDVQGAASMRKVCPDAVSIFLRASSLAAYEQRIRSRGTEDEATIQRRLAGVQRELGCEKDYNFTVINDNLDQAVVKLEEIIRDQFKGQTHA